MCFECRLLNRKRNRERGVVCGRVGLDQLRTNCAGLNSLTGSTTERPQCLVHPRLLPPLVLVSFPSFNIISLLPCFVFFHLIATPSIPSLLLSPLLSYFVLSFALCIVTPISSLYLSLLHLFCSLHLSSPCLLSLPTPTCLLASFLILLSPCLSSCFLPSHCLSSPLFSFLLISYPPCSYFLLQVLAKYLQKTKDTVPDICWHADRGSAALRVAQMSTRLMRKKNPQETAIPPTCRAALNQVKPQAKPQLQSP